MSSLWKTIIALAVALPLAAFVVGTLVASADDGPPTDRPVLEMQEPDRTDEPTDRPDGDRRPDKDDDGRGGEQDDDDGDDDDEVERIQPDPEDLADEREDRRDDQRDAREDRRDDDGGDRDERGDDGDERDDD